MAVTRFGLEGYGVRPAGSFSGKTVGAIATHPVGVITRLGLDGYGVRRAGTFGGKTTGAVSSTYDDYIVRARRRGRR
jgi:hypothetical protein